MVEITIRDSGKRRMENFFEKVGAARDFPRIEFIAKFFSPIPKVVRLFFSLLSIHGMGRHCESPLGTNRSRKVSYIGFGTEVFRYSKPDHMSGATVANRILGQLNAGDKHHLVQLPGPHCFRSDNVLVERKRRRRKRSVQYACGLPDQTPLFAEVVGNRDRAEATAPIQVDDLWDRQLTVTKRRVNVKIS